MLSTFNDTRKHTRFRGQFQRKINKRFSMSAGCIRGLVDQFSSDNPNHFSALLHCLVIDISTVLFIYIYRHLNHSDSQCLFIYYFAIINNARPVDRTTFKTTF